jgi:hypothetical protein
MSASPVHRRLGRGRRAARRPLAALAVLGTVVVAAFGAPPGGAAALPRQVDAVPRLELVGQTFGVEPDGTIVLRYRLTGIVDDALEFLPRPAIDATDTSGTTDTADASGTTGADPTAPPEVGEPPVELPPPVRLTLEITNYAPLASAADLDDVIGDDVDPDAFSDVIDGVAISDVRSLATVDGDDVLLEIEIGTDVESSVEERLKLDRPGVYPLRTQLLVGDPRDDLVVATAGTVIQRLPGPIDQVEPPPPIDLSVVTVTPSPRANASAAELDAARQALDDAIVLADGLVAPVTLEVPPQLVAEATDSPADAERIADALRGDELVALPIVPLDVSAAAAVGRGDTFARLLNAGQDLLTAAVPTTPSRRDVWITPDELSGEGAQELRDLGVRYVVMTAETYRSTVDPILPATDLFVETTLPDGDDLPLLVVGPLAAELDPAAADDILAEVTSTQWAVTTIAELVLDQDDADAIAIGTSGATPPERSVLLTTPSLLPPDLRLLSALETVAETTTSVRFTPASELIGVTDVQLDDAMPVTVELPQVAGPPLADRIERLDSAALTMLSAASMLPADDPRPAEWSTQLEALISTGYSDEEVETTTASLVAEADEIKSAVVMPEPFTFTLTGRSGPIEIRLGNTSSEPLDVLMRLESTKVDFPDGDQVVTLRPNDETSVIVPVEARSNGTSSIELSISTPAGEQLGDPVSLTSRVTGFTGLGQLLMGALILVLLTWWFSHWRARRRQDAEQDGRERHPSTREVRSDAL